MTSAQFRDAILAGITALPRGQFRVSDELPWISGGIPLYTKNYRVFYVDQPETEQESLINTLCGGMSLSNKTTRVRVFVTIDAKQKPANYDSLVEAVQDVRMSTAIVGVRSREVDVITTFEDDAITTEFEFRFTETVFS